MEIAWPGELPVYHTLPGPLATQQGALAGIRRCRPDYRVNIPLLVHDSEAIGAVGRSESQNVSPERLPERGTDSRMAGSVMVVLVPLSAPLRVSGS